MRSDFFLKHSLVLVPTPIGSDVLLNGSGQSILLEIFSNFGADRVIPLVEEAKNSRSRWSSWGLPKHWMNEWELHNEHNQQDPAHLKSLVEKMKQGKTLFLFSDAGLPCLSDPGRFLVNACWENQLKVTSLYFDNSSLLALVLSGFQTAPHLFYGFLPREEFARKAALKEVMDNKITTILMETPYRLSKFLKELKDYSAEKSLSKGVKFFLGLNLNQTDEQLYRGNLDYIMQKVPTDLKAPFIFIKSSEN
ncbi:MAG: hypothetical protein QE271_02280 [Bacteriovoracaceae bacterium]|nr:hypothetical protein [Bacteriovoracaceae bacterium]